MASSSAAEHHEQADTITGADRPDHLRDALVIPNTIGAWDSVPLLGAVGSTSGYFFHADACSHLAEHECCVEK